MSKSTRYSLRIDFVTLFPEMVQSVLDTSIISRARNNKFLETRCINPRDFSDDKHRKIDARPYGGGPGMILMAEPVHQAIRKAATPKSHVIFLSPQGRRLNQEIAKDLSLKPHLVLVCGHYEGVDERLRSDFDEEISIGDYVLTGGELPALVLADAVTRLIPGVLKKADAVEKESFSGPLLDFPQYTRPQNWRGKKIPEVLISGNHELIRQWRSQAAETITRLKRPDLMTQKTGRKK